MPFSLSTPPVPAWTASAPHSAACLSYLIRPSGGTMANLVPAGQAATLTGTVDVTDGTLGSGAATNSSADKIDTGLQLSPLTAWTLFMVVDPQTSGGNNGYGAFFGFAGNPRNCTLACEGSNTRHTLRINGSNIYVNKDIGLNNTEGHIVVVTFDGVTVRTVVDGVTKDETAYALAVIYNGSFCFGTDADDGSTFSGFYLGGVLNAALTEAEAIAFCGNPYELAGFSVLAAPTGVACAADSGLVTWTDPEDLAVTKHRVYYGLTSDRLFSFEDVVYDGTPESCVLALPAVRWGDWYVAVSAFAGATESTLSSTVHVVSSIPTARAPLTDFPRDAAGFSHCVPSLDSRAIYLDPENGSDTNSGLSEDEPLLIWSTAYDLLRDGYPDHLYVARGTSKNHIVNLPWTKSGRSFAEAMEVEIYGAGARPIFDWTAYPTSGGDGRGFGSNHEQIDYTIFRGLHFKATAYDGKGGQGDIVNSPSFNCHGTGMAWEDCHFQTQGLFQEFGGTGLTKLRCRRNIYHNITFGGGQGAVGFLADLTVDELCEDNVCLTTDDWRYDSADPGDWVAANEVRRTSHMPRYPSPNAVRFVMRGNATYKTGWTGDGVVVVGAGGGGIESRNGGLCEYNIAVQCSQAFVWSASAGGVSTVRYNYAEGAFGVCWGFVINSAGTYSGTGNVAALGTEAFQHAFLIDASHACAVTLRGNIAYHYGGNESSGLRLSTAADPAFTLNVQGHTTNHAGQNVYILWLEANDLTASPWLTMNGTRYATGLANSVHDSGGGHAGNYLTNKDARATAAVPAVTPLTLVDWSDGVNLTTPISTTVAVFNAWAGRAPGTWDNHKSPMAAVRAILASHGVSAAGPQKAVPISVAAAMRIGL